VISTSGSGNVTHTYTIQLLKAALPSASHLARLELSVGTLDPPLDDAVQEYRVVVPYTVDNVTVTPFATPKHHAARDVEIWVNGGQVLSGEPAPAITLDHLGETPINITVEAHDGFSKCVGVCKYILLYIFFWEYLY